MQTAQKPQAFDRRGSWWMGAALAPLLMMSGCASNTQTGALAGAGVGGAAGALIGHATGHTGAGAVIGAAVGSLVGASAGSSADESERRQAIRQDVAARGGPLGLEQIRDMAQSNISDTVIIEQIRVTRSAYQLTSEQITWLHQQGVSDTVINAMQNTAYGAPRRVYVVEPAPPPVVGIGFSYGRR